MIETDLKLYVTCWLEGSYIFQNNNDISLWNKMIFNGGDVKEMICVLYCWEYNDLTAIL